MSPGQLPSHSQKASQMLCSWQKLVKHSVKPTYALGRIRRRGKGRDTHKASTQLQGSPAELVFITDFLFPWVEMQKRDLIHLLKSNNRNVFHEILISNLPFCKMFFLSMIHLGKMLCLVSSYADQILHTIWPQGRVGNVEPKWKLRQVYVSRKPYTQLIILPNIQEELIISWSL